MRYKSFSENISCGYRIPETFGTISSLKKFITPTLNQKLQRILKTNEKRIDWLIKTAQKNPEKLTWREKQALWRVLPAKATKLLEDDAKETAWIHWKAKIARSVEASGVGTRMPKLHKRLVEERAANERSEFEKWWAGLSKEAKSKYMPEQKLSVKAAMSKWLREHPEKRAENPLDPQGNYYHHSRGWY